MRTIILLSFIVLLIVKAQNCDDYHDAYETANARYTTSVKTDSNTTLLYNQLNETIDARLLYLAYCESQMSTRQSYHHMQSLRQESRLRDQYAKRLLLEFRKALGIRPKVNTVYQNGGRRTTSAQRPGNMPRVNSRPLPPVTRF